MSDALKDIFEEAHNQAIFGKGLQRHGDSEVPFEDQYICSHPFDPGANFFQAEKKIREADRFLKKDEASHACFELLGAINYLAAAVIKIRREYVQL